MRVDDGALVVARCVLDSRPVGEVHRRTRLSVVTRPRELRCRRIVRPCERNPRVHHLRAEAIGRGTGTREGGEMRRVVDAEHERDLEHVARAEPAVDAGDGQPNR